MRVVKVTDKLNEVVHYNVRISLVRQGDIFKVALISTRLHVITCGLVVELVGIFSECAVTSTVDVT